MGFNTRFLGLVRERRVGLVWVHLEEEEQRLCL